MKKILYILLSVCLLISVIVPVSASSTTTGVDWINAVEYGFSNNGSTANDTIMSRYIANDYTTPLYFPAGTYVFNSTINFPDLCFLELDARAELKLVSSTVQNYFITIRKDSTHSNYAFHSYIRGGTINANNCAKVGLGVRKMRHTCFENFILKNVLEKGIITETSNGLATTYGGSNLGTDGASFYRNILIENDTAKEGTIGVFDNGFDNHFVNIEVVNFETGYYTVAGRFDTCSAWFKDNSVISNSTYAQVAGYDVYFNSPAVDTYRYGFQLLWPGDQVHITNMIWITNGGIYTPELRQTYPRCIFNAGANAESGGKKFMVNGLKIGAETDISFSDVALPSSQFLNVRVLNGCDTSMANFRDDGALINDIYNAVMAVGDGVGIVPLREEALNATGYESVWGLINGTTELTGTLKSSLMDGNKSARSDNIGSPTQLISSGVSKPSIMFDFHNVRTLNGFRVYADDGVYGAGSFYHTWSAKSAHIEYSYDGNTWIVGETVTQSNQANDYLDVKYIKGGLARTVSAQYVKLVIDSAYNEYEYCQWASREITVLTK